MRAAATADIAELYRISATSKWLSADNSAGNSQVGIWEDL